MPSLSSIRGAAELAMKVMESLSFEPELCLRQISPRSGCDLCAQICPVDAISFEAPKNLGQIASMSLNQDSCIECGLCTTVCPTSAFIWTNPTLMQLRNKIAKTASRKEGVVYLTCAKTGAVGESSNIITVPCLGMLPAEFWLSIHSDYDNIAIYLPSDLCSECEITGGEDSLIQEISAAELVGGKTFDLVERHNKLEYVVAEKTAGYDMSKRNFFSDIAEAARKGASVAVDSVTKHEEERPRSAIDRFRDERALDQIKAGKEPFEGDEDRPILSLGKATVVTGRREILLETLKHHPELSASTPLRLPHVTEGCTLCKACAFMCPTESLRVTDDSLVLNPHSCVGCGLCSVICYPQAIELYERNANVYFETPVITLVGENDESEAEMMQAEDTGACTETDAASATTSHQERNDHANQWRTHSLDEIGAQERLAESESMTSTETTA